MYICVEKDKKRRVRTIGDSALKSCKWYFSSETVGNIKIIYFLLLQFSNVSERHVKMIFYLDVGYFRNISTVLVSCLWWEGCFSILPPVCGLKKTKTKNKTKTYTLTYRVKILIEVWRGCQSKVSPLYLPYFTHFLLLYVHIHLNARFKSFIYTPLSLYCMNLVKFNFLHDCFLSS